jgi:hypothetical protein
VSVVAYVPDLMDRSRISAAVADVRFVASPGELAGAATEADVVVVDLGRPGVVDVLPGLPGRVLGFVSHVDRATLAAAEAAGSEAMARSEFFSRVAELLEGA